MEFAKFGMNKSKVGHYNKTQHALVSVNIKLQIY